MSVQGDVLEKPVKAGVRKAMQKFQLLSVPELHADKGLHLESVQNAQDAPHADHPHQRLTPAPEKAAAAADSLLFAKYWDTVLRELGIDDQVLRAVRTIVDKAQLKAFETLLPEDQCEVLQYLAEGFGPDEVYRDVVAVRRPVDAGPDPDESLAVAIANTTNRITLVTGPEELADILGKPFTAWRVFLHPSRRRVPYRVSYGGPVQITGGPGTGKTVAALRRVKHLLTRSRVPNVMAAFQPARGTPAQCEFRLLRTAVPPDAGVPRVSGRATWQRSCMPIVVTCATGSVGSTVVRRLKDAASGRARAAPGRTVLGAPCALGATIRRGPVEVRRCP